MKGRNFDERIKALPWVFWAMAGTGFALPWATGIGVKLYLQAQGRPTLPWKLFLNPQSLLWEIPITLLWASPFIGLGLGAGPLLRTEARLLSWSIRPERAVILAGAFVGGVAGAIRTFLLFFWQFEPIAWLMPLLPITYLDDMGLGLIGGLGLAATSAGSRKILGPRRPPAEGV